MTRTESKCAHTSKKVKEKCDFQFKTITSLNHDNETEQNSQGSFHSESCNPPCDQKNLPSLHQYKVNDDIVAIFNVLWTMRLSQAVRPLMEVLLQYCVMVVGKSET